MNFEFYREVEIMLQNETLFQLIVEYHQKIIMMTKRITILDGGFSTQLATHVKDKIDGDPLWTARFLATNPNEVFQTHLDYLRAGANIIETNTYQASIEGFVKYLGINETESLNLIHKAVDLAQQAVKVFLEERKIEEENFETISPIIAGSCGPYGASLHDGSEYTGEYAASVSKDFLMNWHRPRIEALIEKGVKLLALETIPCKVEAEALVELLKDYENIKAWLSFSCKTDGTSIVDGNNFQKVATDCYKSALPGQIIAVGVNCISPSAITPLLSGFNQSPSTKCIPLIVYPNSGEQYTVLEGWKRVSNEPPLETFIQEWLDTGVKFIGGCCRTFAYDIPKIIDEVTKWELEQK